MKEELHEFLHYLTGQLTMSPFDFGCFAVVPNRDPKDDVIQIEQQEKEDECSKPKTS